MKNNDSMIGSRFGRLTVLSDGGLVGRNRVYKCKCDCGTEKIIHKVSLLSKSTISCGCATRERMTTHGMSNTKVFKIWVGMKKRCNRNTIGSKYYKDKGITYDPNWNSFEKFYKDMGDPPTDKHELDRKNSDGIYCKNNCKWSTRTEQMNNMSCNVHLTFEGKTQTIAEWAREKNINYSTLTARLGRGWTTEEALTGNHFVDYV
jgi:hypothetical protein